MTRRLGRRLLVALVLAFLVIPTASAGAQTTPEIPTTPPTAPARADLVDIEDEVMCIVCRRPLSTSGGDAATDQRTVIQGLIDTGLTKAQIKDRLVAEYGEQVLVNDRSPIAAAAPILAGVVGLGSVLLLLRRRRAGAARGTEAPDGDAHDRAMAERIPTDADLGDPLAAHPTSAADDARIDAELADRD